MYDNHRKDRLERGYTRIKLLLLLIFVCPLAIGIVSCHKKAPKSRTFRSNDGSIITSVPLPKNPPSYNKFRPCDESCIKEKIESGKKEMNSLKFKRDKELTNLYSKHSIEYQHYHRNLRSELLSLGIKNHEEFVRKCDEHIKLCNLLERTAFLQHSMKFVGEKIKEVNTKYYKLDQIVWVLEKKLELGEIIDSPEEEKKVNEIINSTKEILEEKITPPEAQDIGKLEKTIFEEIMGRR